MNWERLRAVFTNPTSPWPRLTFLLFPATIGFYHPSQNSASSRGAERTGNLSGRLMFCRCCLLIWHAVIGASHVVDGRQGGFRWRLINDSCQVRCQQQKSFIHFQWRLIFLTSHLPRPPKKSHYLWPGRWCITKTKQKKRKKFWGDHTHGTDCDCT